MLGDDYNDKKIMMMMLVMMSKTTMIMMMMMMMMMMIMIRTSVWSKMNADIAQIIVDQKSFFWLEHCKLR